jgi:MYXO-CTERM domain-containing protein
MAGGIASSTMQGDVLLAGSIQWSAGQASQASTSLGGTVPLAPRGGCATCAVGTGGERAVLALGGLALVALVLQRRRRAR